MYSKYPEQTVEVVDNVNSPQGQQNIFFTLKSFVDMNDIYKINKDNN